MIDIEEVLARSTPETITALKNKSVNLPNWDRLLTDYEPSKHRITVDPARKDEVKGGKVIKHAKITIPYEQIVVDRLAQFCFAIPVQRTYPNATEEGDMEITQAMERIYNVARINSANKARAKNYFAACEVVTIWYTKEERNSLYGFDSNYKLKCASYSPMDGYDLYPLFDEQGDMVAMSIEYKRTVTNEEVRFFETYTATRHIKWQLGSTAKVIEDDNISLGKIPCIYMYRHEPVYKNITTLRDDIEYAISRNSDIVANNAAPILKVTGQLFNPENKTANNPIQMVQTEQGGDVGYVTWPQSNEAVRYNVETLEALIFKITQMPDVSFSNMAKLGNIGYDARKTLLTDAHLKVGDESGKLIEFLDREVNVVKAFLKLMRPDWSARIDALDVVNEITPFVQDDESASLDRILKANGQKAVISQRESILLAGYSSDPDKTLQDIQAEEATDKGSDIADIMAAGTYN